MKLLLLQALGFLCIIIFSPANAQNNSAAVNAQVAKYLDLVGDYGNAGQVLIAEGNNIIIDKNYGYASRESKVPVDDETIFELASASKMFTASAILKLEMQGKLTVQDTLGKYFNNCPKNKCGITIHQLLTHSSGIMGGDIVDDFQPMSKDDLCKKILNSPLKARPGQKFIYSNAGFNLLAAIIEKLSGKEYGEYLHDELFAPAGMQHTFVNGSLHLKGKRVATAYNGVQNNGAPNRQDFNVRTWGGGSVCSTAPDLWLWRKALMGNAILNDSAKAKMFKAQMVIAPDNNYGYGCFVYWIGGKKIIDFIGETERGFNCTFRNFIDDNATFISLSNASQPNERHNRWFIDAHVKNLWKENTPFPLPPPVAKIQSTTLNNYAGVYEYNNSRIKISSSGDGLVLEAEGIEASNLLFGYTAEPVQKFDKVIKGVEKYMNDYKQKTDSGIIEVFGAGNAPDYIKERDNLVAKYGYIKSYSVKGAFFDRDTNFVITPVVMQLAGKEIEFFIMWNITDTGKPVVDYAAPELVTRIAKIFACTGKNEFVNYNFFRDEVESKIQFDDSYNIVGSIGDKNIRFVKVKSTS